ncbi:MAG: hypothetical protein KME49_07540 [Brasilonema octagenarum HA4186-MV1]|jgi:hypothetical protein|nr:hypothetical protein [Brasilonema octagenarum HA4186-MV1]
MYLYLKQIFFKSPQNITALILRYLNIWYLVGVPLFFSVEHKIINTLPLVGIGGLSFLIIGMLFPLMRKVLIQYYYYFSLLLLIVAVIALIFMAYREFNYYIFSSFAFILGFSTASCEIKCVFLSIINEGVDKKAENLQIYNMLKVAGIGIGFFSGAMLSGRNNEICVSLIFTILLLVILCLLTVIELQKFYKPSSEKIHNIGFSHFSIRKNICLVLFVLDVSLFTFWYIYLPKHMISNGFQGIDISLFLAIQSISHAGSQNMWRKVILQVGAMKGYWLSFVLHIAIVIFIGNSKFGYLESLSLFTLMGMLNSGTFLASSLLYYHNNNKALGDNYIHLGASHLGKYVGAVICSM